MHICFIYPSYVRHAEANPEIREDVSAGSYLGSPTMGIALLAGMVPDEHDITFIDDRVEQIPWDEKFDLVAMPVFTPAAKRAMQIADEFRSRGVQVAVGGIFSSLMPQEMAPHVDAVCIGEGEGIWLQLIEDAKNRCLKPIYQATEDYDLSKLPPPRWDLYFDKEGGNGYRSTGSRGQLTVDYALQISRGCALRCPACVIPEYMGRKMRFMDPEWVADNFRAMNQGGVERYISLTEDTSSFPAQRIIEHFVETLTRCEGLGTTISYVGASPQQAMLASPEFFKNLRKLNAVSIYMVFGFDPASRNAFSANPDPKHVQTVLDAVQRVRDQGMGVYASLLAGHDEENKGVFDRILEYTEKAKIDTAEFVMLTPYPGTPLWRKLTKEDRIITRDWSLYNDANPTFTPKNMTPDELRAGYTYIWREFYRRNSGTRHTVQV